MRLLALVAALAVATPVMAQSAATSFTLTDKASAPAGRTILDGATWRCDDQGVCVATGGREQPAERACRRVVARFGAVSDFSWKGEALSADQVAACNAAASA